MIFRQVILPAPRGSADASALFFLENQIKELLAPCMTVLFPAPQIYRGFGHQQIQLVGCFSS